MKTSKTIVMLSVVAGLCLSAGAQAFCFMKGNNGGSRMQNYYSQPMPAVGFSPAQYYATPYAQPPGAGWNGYGYPAAMQGNPYTGQLPGAQVWR